MKKYFYLLLVICSLLSITVFGQSEIDFNIDNSKIISPNNKQDGYSLPIYLLFDKTNFKGRKIKLLTFDNKTIYSGEFGVDIIGKYKLEDKYLIEIDKSFSVIINGEVQDHKASLNNIIVQLVDDKENRVIVKFIDSMVQGNEDEGEDKYQPGYLIYDAQYIVNNFLPGKYNPTIDKILAYYKIYGSNIKQNKYLESVLTKTELRNIESPLAASTTANVLSYAGSLDVTTIADGFAIFIVKRTKQELSIAFFEKFKKKLDDTPDLEALFPQTHKTLTLIDTEIYMFEAYIQALRESFEKDLSLLPTNLPRILYIHKEYFEANEELAAILRSGFYFTKSIQDKKNPGQIIEDYPIDSIQSLNKNVIGSINTLQLLSESLKSNDPNNNNYWAPEPLLQQLISNDRLLKIYLGLLTQKAKEIDICFIDKDGKDYKLYNILNSSLDNVIEYKAFIKTVSQKVQLLDSKIENIKGVKNDSLLYEKYYDVISSSIDLFEYSIEVVELPGFPPDMHLADSTKLLFDIIQTSADVGISINRRNYSSAIVNSAYIYSKVLKQVNYKRKSKINKLSLEVDSWKEELLNTNLQLDYTKILIKIKDSLKTNDPGTLLMETEIYLSMHDPKLSVSSSMASETALYLISDTEYVAKLEEKILNSKSNYDKSNLALDNFKENHIRESLQPEIIQEFLRYGTFMSLVVQAKSSEEVASAIEAFALPTGSARIKRESSFNVSLNAYCGVFGGYERIEGIDNTINFNTYGVTAPIGIAVSSGHSILFFIPTKKGWSSSIYFSIVDIGALTAFRITDDETVESVPNIQLKDIISPGIFYSLGIPRSPLSINIGLQSGPLLRKINLEEGTYSNSYCRFSLSLLVDIPIVNFYTKLKN